VKSGAGAVTVGLLAVVSALACTSNSDPGSDAGPIDSGGIVDCPDDLPFSCPASAPTYAKDIQPIVRASCAGCHAPGARVPDRLLVTYDQIYAQRGAVLLQVNACRMPPRDAAALGQDARKALLTWLVCGAKND